MRLLNMWLVGKVYLGEIKMEKKSKAYKELVVRNTLFKKDIHKYTWMRQDNGRVVNRAMMNDVVVSRNVIGQNITS